MQMRRVVVTGLGIVSSIGNNADEVTASLRDAKSGISFSEDFAEHGFRCQVWGAPTLDPTELVDRRAMRFLSQGRRLEPCRHGAGDRRCRARGERHHQRAHRHHHGLGRAVDPHHRRGRRHHPQEQQPQAHRPVRRAEGDVVDRLGDACHLVQDPRRQLFDLVGLLDLGALHRQRLRDDPVGQAGHRCSPAATRISTGRCRTCSTPWARCPPSSTTTPATASRAYDADRDGFVIAGGAGVLVLEELEHAKARGAKIYAEIVGYGATSDGYDMVAPSGEGAVRCMRQALATVNEPIDYINTHGTSTPVGDSKEIGAIREVFGDDMPAHHLDQVADRPFAGRRRRAGIDLLDPDDAGRLHRRERPYRERSTRNSRACRSCASASTTPRSTRCCPTPSASAAPTPRSSSSATTR